MNKSLKKEKDNSLKIFGIVFAAGLASRVLLFLAGIWMMKCFEIKINLTEFFGTTGDAVHYVHIAQNGYAAAGDAANKIVFYPLFPMLMRVLYFVIRNYVWSGLVISYLTFGVACAYLYKLMRIDYSESKTIDALMLLCIAPYGMFFISVHTESLFLMLSVMTLYYARKENYIAASIAGFFAALTKSQGMLLIVPVVYEWIINCTRDKKFCKKGISALLIPMGFVIYLCINKVVQGDFFAFVNHQAAEPWYNTAKWVSDSLSTSYNIGSDYYGLSMIIYWPQIILFFVAVAFIFVGVYKKVRTSYLAFLGVYTLVTYFHGWMLSGARYMTSCIVMYIVMASIDNKITKCLLYTISGGLCLHLMLMWFQGYAIM